MLHGHTKKYTGIDCGKLYENSAGEGEADWGWRGAPLQK